MICFYFKVKILLFRGICEYIFINIWQLFKMKMQGLRPERKVLDLNKPPERKCKYNLN